MKSSAFLTSLLTASAALAVTTISHAQILSGTSQGAFRDPLPPSSVVSFNPAPAGTFAGISTFMTGQNDGNAPQFTGARYTALLGGFNNFNLATNSTLKLGDFSWFNTVTVGTTAANSVTFDLKLSFTSPGLQEIVYSPFNVTFDGGGDPAKDNLFTISAPSGGLINFGGNVYSYSFSFDTSAVTLAEPSLTTNLASSASTGIYITFVAVPEPSTYGVFAIAMIAVTVAIRRRRA